MDLFLSEHKAMYSIIWRGLDFSISDFSLSVILAPLCMFGVFYVMLLKTKFYPVALQNFAESVYEGLHLAFSKHLGAHGAKYLPFIFSLMLYIISLNLVNLLPFAFACTTQLAITLTLSMMVFALIICVGLYEHGILGFVRKFVPPGVPLAMTPFLFIIELMTFLIRPLSLAGRLTLNMFVGHMMLHVVSSLGNTYVSTYILTLLMCIIFTLFELAVAFLQAYIFCLLSSMYIGSMLSSEH